MATTPSSLLRRIRSNATVNACIRILMRGALGAGMTFRQQVVGRWPVAGDVEVESNGVRFRLHAECDDGWATYLYYGFPLEGGESAVWSLLAQHAGTVFDIGANTGYYSILTARLNPAARIFAFEPHPTNYRRLERNLQLNGIDSVRAVRAAVGDEERQIELTIPEDDTISLVSSAVRAHSESFFNIRYKQVEVPQRTIDHFARSKSLESVDLIKIDVESYELAVLRGASETLARHSPVLMAEVFNPDVVVGNKPHLRGRLNANTALEVERLLFDLGYHAFAIGQLGVLRVRDLRSIPDGGSNYLFTKAAPRWSYASYNEPERIQELVCRR